MESPPRKRLKRIEQPGYARFLNFSCYRNQPLLSEDRARQWLIDAIAATRTAQNFHLWAFVIMPDHVHLLIRPRTPVSGILRSMKQSVARRAVQWAKQHDPGMLRRMLAPDGVHRFWQRGGGYDRNLWEPKLIWQAIDYIHMNPVRAGLCKSSHDWRWSSALYFRDRSEPLIPLDTASIPPRPPRTS